MTVKGNLIFFLNRRCTVGCASCNAGASEGNTRELTPRWMDTFFDRIDDLFFSGYIIWTGGEPFLSFETLEKGINRASHRGFNSEILTSGSWFENNPGFLETLAATGNFSLRISLDEEHQERIPMDLVISLIKKALDLKIEVNFTLRDIPGGKKNKIKEIEKHLPGFYKENRGCSRWIHSIPHMPISPGDSRPRIRGRKWRKTCRMGFRDLVIGEDGLAYPCCGLFGVPGHERLTLGNPLTQSWRTLETTSQANPLLRILKEKGPYGICSELNLDPEIWDWPALDSQCHLCLALFRLHGERVFEHFKK